MDDSPPPKQQDAGAPAWVMTFADLMSLLMCFFVLILSFSEMDLIKYKQLAGSMAEAFGVQRDIKVKDPPKGINVIAREFSPGRPVPTPLNVVKQNTTDHLRRNLYVPDSEDRQANADSLHINSDDYREQRLEQNQADDERRTEDKSGAGPGGDGDGSFEQGGSGQHEVDPIEPNNSLGLEKARFEEEAEKIRQMLYEEIQSENVEVLTDKSKIIIRIRERGLFLSGSASMESAFIPVAEKLVQVLRETPGEILVSGHTDNVPISTSRFPSNWALSSARALSVVHHFLQTSSLDPKRFAVAGYGEMKPIESNASAVGRAKNRRVELSISRGPDIQKNTVTVMKRNNPVIDQLLGNPIGSERKAQDKIETEQQKFVDDDNFESLLRTDDNALDKLLWDDDDEN